MSTLPLLIDPDALCWARVKGAHMAQAQRTISTSHKPCAAVLREGRHALFQVTPPFPSSTVRPSFASAECTVPLSAGLRT